MAFVEIGLRKGVHFITLCPTIDGIDTSFCVCNRKETEKCGFDLYLVR